MQKQSWQLEGCKVKGKYLDIFPYTGVVTLSRVKYGGHVQHTVKLTLLLQFSVRSVTTF